MTPKADFVCLSKKCEPPPDQEPDLFEAPIGATRCPVCGSKRIKRLFNKIGVIGLRSTLQPDPDWRASSSSALRRSDALLTDGFDAQYTRRASAREMPTYGAGDQEREVSTARGKFITPSRAELGQMFGLGGKGSPMTQMEVAREIKRDRLSVPAVLQQLNQRPVPTVVVGRPK